jgi:hypothetical protein
MEITISFNGAIYLVAKSSDGWLYVQGPEQFKFTRDKSFFWHFSKEIDKDLQVSLKAQVISAHLLDK